MRESSPADLIEAQQERGQTGPLEVKRRRQHSPVGVVHLTGPPHSVRAMTVIPAAPTSPSPPSTGAIPARPRPPAVAPASTAVLPKLPAYRRAKPPGQRVTIEIVLKRLKIFPDIVKNCHLI